jgi:acyl-CoA thioester hydrolase
MGRDGCHGHVNNAVYFRYFESARTAYLYKLGLFASIDQTGVRPILGSIHCNFKLQLPYPDTVSVGARVQRVEQDRFVIEHCVVSHNTQRVAAEGDGILVAYNHRDRKKTLLPEAITEAIESLEESAHRRK